MAHRHHRADAGRHQLRRNRSRHLSLGLRRLAGLEHEERDAVVAQQRADLRRVDEPRLALVLPLGAITVFLEHEPTEPLVAVVHALTIEVHDVEAWREHYALTLEHWYCGLMKNREEAIEHVGLEKFRMWAIYLAGGSVGFADASIHICQVVASKMNPGVTMVVAKVLAVCLVGLSVELVFVGLNSWGVVEIVGLKAG